MTLHEAFKQFSESPEFKAIALKRDNTGGKFRVYLSRFKKGELKAGAITEILLANGYEVKANKVRKK
jgi:hypothetical protein